MMAHGRQEIAFHLVDVFADAPLSGNPLAVVPDADALEVAVMQRIAREFNQSETTFLLTPTIPGADHRLRSFTPSGDEVFGAGHNALGAWWWLAEAGRLGPLASCIAAKQELGNTVLPVDVIVANAQLAQIGLTQGGPQLLAAHEQPAALAAALGLASSDLSTDSATAPQVASTGVPHLMVRAASREALERSRPDATALLRELRSAGAQGCYVFCLEPAAREATAHARFFNPTVGIWEDPATGSAAGPLAWLLAARGLVPRNCEVTVEQGHHVGRPSRLNVHVDSDRVQLRGRCVTVASGILRL